MYSAVEQIAKHLGGAKKTTNGWDCKCPLHEDKKSSLSVAVGSKGGIVMHCHAGCFGDDLVNYIKTNTNLWPQSGRPRANTFPSIDFTKISSKPITFAPPKAVPTPLSPLPPASATPPAVPKPKPEIAAVYPYVDEAGKPLFEAVRMEPKDFRQRVLQDDGTYSWTIKGIRRVPYRLPELLAAIAAGKDVLICEGEKDVDRAYAAGLIATCNPMGADNGAGNKWLPEFSQYFVGASVIVIPDQDEPGRKHAAHVINTLKDVALHLGTANPTTGKDLADWLDAGATEADIHNAVVPYVALSDEKPATSIQSSIISFDDVLAMENMKWLIKDVIPLATTGAIYGPSSSGKSFVAFDALAAVARGDEYWFGHRIHEHRPVLIVALEGSAGLPQRVKAYMNEKGNPGKGLLFKITPLNILDRAQCDVLCEEILALNLINPIVNIDTLNQATPGMDENSPEMALAIEAQKYISHRINGMVVFTHHTGKDLSKGMRGHSSLRASLDWTMEVRKDEKGNRSWVTEKLKDGPDGGGKSFELKVVQVGTDQFGDPETSCVVVECAAADPLFQVVAQDRDKNPVELILFLDQFAIQNYTIKELETLMKMTNHQVRNGYSALKKLNLIDDDGITQLGKEEWSRSGGQVSQKGKAPWKRGK